MEFILIIKKLHNTLSSEEAKIFSSWYAESSKHKAYFEVVKANFDRDITLVDTQKDWLSIACKLKGPKKVNYFWSYAVACSLTLFITVTFFLNKSTLNGFDSVQDRSETAIKNPVLSLADGSNVVLKKGSSFKTNEISSNGKDLIYNPANDSVTKLSYNYLSIPRGGKFHITLSDGTEVWLNSESKIKYPISFIPGKDRVVELLYGEAYFDVSPSVNHSGSSFKVVSKTQELEVLGTEFNLRSYKDETYVYTTLVEGEILINMGVNSTRLSPNHQTVLNIQSSAISKSIVDVYNVTSWRNGVFSFSDKPLDEIMKTLSRWYDIDIIFESETSKKIKFNGVLNKSQDIKTILSIIKTTSEIDYEVVSDRVIIK